MIKHTKRTLLAVAALSALISCGTTQAESPKDQDKAKESTQSANQKQDGAQHKTDDKDLKAQAPKEVDVKKVSQALGNFIGRNLKSPGVNLDTESIISGIRDGAEGKPSPMTDKEYEAAMTTLQQNAVEALANTNLEAAEKFIKENASAKGVVELVPGKLQYIILTEGKDPVVPEHGTPLVNYTGKYIDGTVFGTSESAGGPIAVPIDQTIPGFSKGIAGMKEGEKRRLFVHPEMGYGRTGQLPPNSLLIFDIEVVKATAPEKEISDADGDDDGLFEEDVIEISSIGSDTKPATK